jgi:hypothetical protein
MQTFEKSSRATGSERTSDKLAHNNQRKKSRSTERNYSTRKGIIALFVDEASRLFDSILVNPCEGESKFTKIHSIPLDATQIKIKRITGMSSSAGREIHISEATSNSTNRCATSIFWSQERQMGDRLATCQHSEQHNQKKIFRIKF